MPTWSSKERLHVCGGFSNRIWHESIQMQVPNDGQSRHVQHRCFRRRIFLNEWGLSCGPCRELSYMSLNFICERKYEKLWSNEVLTVDTSSIHNFCLFKPFRECYMSGESSLSGLSSSPSDGNVINHREAHTSS